LHEPTRQARRRRRRRRNRSDQASHCSVAVPHPADLGSIGIGSQQAPSPPPAPSSRAGPAAAGPARSRPRPRQGARPPPVPDWRTARPSPRPGGGVRLRDCPPAWSPPWPLATARRQVCLRRTGRYRRTARRGHRNWFGLACIPPLTALKHPSPPRRQAHRAAKVARRCRRALGMVPLQSRRAV